MTLCNSTNYFYINTNNKKICFKTEVNNLCPSSYPIYDEINHNCYSKNELYLSEMIKSFQSYITNEIDRTSIDNGNDLIISTDEMTYALTTTKNQLMKINEDITTIDLGECDYLLKKEYNISLNDSLYILKIDLLVDGIQKVEYEVYYNFSLNDLTKLNLTVCENVKIDILIPKNISINDIDKYNKNSGYYNDICYTLTTDAGTDISLNDRRIEYQKNNLSICEEGCEFSGYNLIAKKVICSCYTKMNLPIITELKVDKQQLFSNFKDIRNIANFKMLKCIKLFFNKNNIFKNMSNYMMIILFILSIISIFIFAFYVYKKINEFLQIKKKKISIKLLSTNITTKNIKKKTDVKNYNNHNGIKKIVKKNIKKIFVMRNKNSVNLEGKYNSIEKESSDEVKLKSFERNDYELNELVYEDALKYDKRNFYQLYLSFIKTRHLLFFTFFQNKDYNSQIIKIYIFLFTFGINLTVSAMFYTDSIIHKIYIDDGSFDFTYQLPQMIYSLIISAILAVLLKYFGLYEQEIVEFRKGYKNRIKVLSDIKIKIIIFFIISYLLLFFSWIYLGCFCAVYKNTQIHLLIHVSSSFSFSFIVPFIVLLFPCIFRIIALNDRKGKRSFLYKMSNILLNL